MKIVALTITDMAFLLPFY